MPVSRRNFLKLAGAATAAASLGPSLSFRKARGDSQFATKRVVILAIGGGLRLRESLGMAEGATSPSLFGNVPLVSGFGDGPVGPAVIAPEYEAAARELVLPPPRSAPLFEEGAVVANLRYAEGAPGHLQGQGCLCSGYYNNLENRADARLPVPTVFELARSAAGTPVTDAWYVSMPGGFYRALAQSSYGDLGARYGATFLSPPGVMSPILPIVTSGNRGIDFDPSQPPSLPTIAYDPDEAAAVSRLAAILDGNAPAPVSQDEVRAGAEERDAIKSYLADFHSDPTYQSYYPDAVGIGLRAGDGTVDPTGDALTTYHAGRVLDRFRPSVMVVTLLDIDQCHGDFNAYIRGQLVADACIRYLWELIQSTDGLRDETALLVVPEHGRHLFSNGQNPDSLGRSGIDHGQGDDGDRDVFLLALGPDFQPGVVEPTGIEQPGRTSGRYETIDAVMTAMTLLGHGDRMAEILAAEGARPGLPIQEILR